RDPARRPLLIVVTDGRATSGGKDPVAESRRAAALLAATGTASVVVDCESGFVRLGLARTRAAHLAGTAVQLEDLSADRLSSLVRTSRRVA
ncbi:MAG: magnesium chelatase subunit, partial [Cryptosporangiaceae bacterium]|nr:magnesium chelatase subunit [Cryptosporangiaceae bacterium]